MNWVDWFPQPDASAWAKGQRDFETAWRTCPRGDWLLWVVGALSQHEGDRLHVPAVQAVCDIVEDTIRKCSGYEGPHPEEGPMESTFRVLRMVRAWAESPSTGTARGLARLGEEVMERAISEPNRDFPRFYCLLSASWVAMAVWDRKVLVDSMGAAAEAVACSGVMPFLEAQARFASIVRARVPFPGHGPA